MIVGALVLVEVTAGMTEASITRSPSSPCTRNSLSTTLSRVRAHQAGAAGVIAGAAVAPRVVEQLVVGLDLRPGEAFFADEALQGGGGEDAAAPSASRR